MAIGWLSRRNLLLGSGRVETNGNQSSQLPRHRRRQFAVVTECFPDECRYAQEMLGQVHSHDAEARERGLTPDERPRFHQQLSG